MRVAITGASGNIGTSLVRALGSAPEVTEIVGVARRLPDWHPPKVRWVQADVVTADLAAAFAGADAVVHLAWAIQPSHDLRALHAVNVVGSTRVFEAAAAAGARVLVHGSSIGAYAPGPADGHLVDETWPTDGIETSFYSRHKAYAERVLDAVEHREPALRVVRIRPALVMKREAATGVRRLFIGPLLPGRLLGRLPVGPTVAGLRLQVVHADDVADAYRRVVLDPAARGAYNLAADPVLEPADLARAIGTRPVPVPVRLARFAADLSWRLRLQPTPAGWVDMAMEGPLLDASRAVRELGWRPAHDARAALGEVVEGLRTGAGGPTPTLDPATSGPGRLREFATGVGGRFGVR